MFVPLRLLILTSLLAPACTTQVGSDYVASVDGGSTKADTVLADAATEPDATPVVTVTGPCEEGDANIESSGVCYQYFFSATTWESARTRCKQVGADLARVDDIVTNGILASLVPNAYPEAWLRGTDAGAEGTWTWAGETMAYTNWRSGEPNNANGNENCMIIEATNGGTWDDRSCSGSLGYVCQRPQP